MSLSARERQTLHTIEKGLAGADPALSSLLARFTLLTSGEEMPAREMIPRGWGRAVRYPGRRRGGAVRCAGRRPRPGGVVRRAGRLPRRLGWQRAMVLLCLVAAVAEGIAVILAVGLTGPQRPRAAPRRCGMVLTRLSPAARHCDVPGITHWPPAVPSATGSQ